MIEQLVVYLVVAAAAVWTAWTLVVRGWWSRRAATRKAAGPASAADPTATADRKAALQAVTRLLSTPSPSTRMVTRSPGCR